MHRFVFPAFAALLCPAPAALADAGDDIAPEADIVVTATRSPVSVDETIVPVTVITRQDIEQSLATDLAELLRFEGGLDIGRQGGPGQATSVFLRGTESNHTLVLVDGIRINPGTVGGAAIQHIAPELVERVEIVKGARSALFGTDAIGGVINIITRRRDRAWADGAIGGGSFDTRSAFLSAGRSSEETELAAAFNFQTTDGFPPRTGSDIDRGYDNLSTSLHAGRRFGANRLSLRHWRAEGTNEYLDFFLAPLDQDFRNESTALELDSALAQGVESKLVLSRITDDIRQNQSADFVESVRHALDWQVDFARGDQRWIGGLYYVDEDAAAVAFGSGFDVGTRTKAAFVEHLWNGDRHRTFAALRLTDHETFGNHVTWNAEYAFALSDRWTLNAGLGHAFRAPDATDRFGFGGNPALDPELADEAQLGLRFVPDARQSLELEVYYMDIEDLIEFDLAAFVLRNIGKAEIRGAELRWEYRGDTWSVLASAVRQSADNALEDVRLPRRAEESLSVKLVRNLGPHRVGLAVLANGDRVDVGDVRMPGYAVASLTGQLALGERWRLNARIENLFDAQYETAAGFPMQGRSAFVDIGWQWQ